MGILKINNEEINSIFELLGEQENDKTYSLGWILCNNNHFL